MAQEVPLYSAMDLVGRDVASEGTLAQQVHLGEADRLAGNGFLRRMDTETAKEARQTSKREARAMGAQDEIPVNRAVE